MKNTNPNEAAPGDAALLRLYVEKHSEAAFAELGRRYARLVFSTCLRETRNRTLAEDAAQGVFLLLSQKASGLKRHESLAGWLYTASCFVARNLMKSERRRQRTEVNAMETMASIPENALWEQIEPHFHAALNGLKPADREAVLLRFVQEQSLAEVGQSLGISENTARMRISRAIEKVRSYLAKVGVTVTVAVLAALLAERSSEAAPASLITGLSRVSITGSTTTVTQAVRQTSQDMTRRGIMRFLFLWGAPIPLFLLVGVGWYWQNATKSVSAAERRRFFETTAGKWTGTLEYADDGTKKHFQFPTTVTFESLNDGTILRASATYTGASNTDVTTFRYSPQDGKFEVTNGGPQSSHQTAGRCELIRQAPNDFTFEGVELTQGKQVRIRLTTTLTALTMQEEYRLPGQTNYTFRNRFTLKRQNI